MKRLWASSSSSERGFTVLEILVSVFVIGVLAIITIVSYDGIQQRSRDTTRDGHITQIKVALERYYANNSQYPSVCPGDGTPCSAQLLAAPLAPFLQGGLPSDPEFSGTANDYQYIRENPGNSFGLRVNYEARPVCKDGVRVNDSWWGASTPRC